MKCPPVEDWISKMWYSRILSSHAKEKMTDTYYNMGKTLVAKDHIAYDSFMGNSPELRNLEREEVVWGLPRAGWRLGRKWKVAATECGISLLGDGMFLVMIAQL
jgi:hypothetical protein